MNMELTLITNRPVFQNPTLEKYTVALMKMAEQVKTRQYDIAFTLGEIQTKGMYKDDGFESCAEYACQTFGMQKTKAYELIDIGQNYCRQINDTRGRVTGHCSNLLPIPHPELMDAPVTDFSTNQIARMRVLGRDKIKELIDAGELLPNMTSRAIDEVVKLHKAKKVKEVKQLDTTEPTEPTEPTEQPEQPEPTIEVRTIGSRDTGWDNASTEQLIAELNARGFTVTRDHTEYRYSWGE